MMTTTENSGVAATPRDRDEAVARVIRHGYAQQGDDRERAAYLLSRADDIMGLIDPDHWPEAPTPGMSDANPGIEPSLPWRLREDHPDRFEDGDSYLVAVGPVRNRETGREWTEFYVIVAQCDSETPVHWNNAHGDRWDEWDWLDVTHWINLSKTNVAGVATAEPGAETLVDETFGLSERSRSFMDDAVDLVMRTVLTEARAHGGDREQYILNQVVMRTRLASATTVTTQPSEAPSVGSTQNRNISAPVCAPEFDGEPEYDYRSLRRKVAEFLIDDMDEVKNRRPYSDDVEGKLTNHLAFVLAKVSSLFDEAEADYRAAVSGNRTGNKTSPKTNTEPTPDGDRFPLVPPAADFLDERGSKPDPAIDQFKAKSAGFPLDRRISTAARIASDFAGHAADLVRDCWAAEGPQFDHVNEDDPLIAAVRSIAENAVMVADERRQPWGYTVNHLNAMEFVIRRERSKVERRKMGTTAETWTTPPQTDRDGMEMPVKGDDAPRCSGCGALVPDLEVDEVAPGWDFTDGAVCPACQEGGS